jgi:hypothetical protein
VSQRLQDILEVAHDDRIQKLALALATKVPVAQEPADPQPIPGQMATRAISQPIDSMAQSTTAQAAVATGGTSATAIVVKGAECLQTAQSVHGKLSLMSILMTLVTDAVVVAGVIGLIASAYIWFER